MQIKLSDLIEAVEALREAHDVLRNHRDMPPEKIGKASANTFSAYAHLRAILVTSGVKVDVKEGA